MEKLKAILKKLLYPAIWIQLLLAAVSSAALAYIFVNGMEENPLSAFAYVLSAYTLTVITISCIQVFPARFKKAKQKIYENKYGNRYITDAAFRIHISLYFSLAVNLLYAASNLISYHHNRSVWFIILTAYYSILALMRFLLVRYVNKVEIGKQLITEFKCARLCAFILLTLNLILTGAVLMILYQSKGFVYPGVMIYVMALYTFYVTINSTVSIFKHRKYNSPIMSTAKIISLAAALVSMLSLETAMLTAFAAENTTETNRTMVALTGAGVSVIIITLSVFMIVKTTKSIKQLNK